MLLVAVVLTMPGLSVIDCTWTAILDQAKEITDYDYNRRDLSFLKELCYLKILILHLTYHK